MSYTATVWSGAILISARRLANADDQYEEAKSYLDAHTHDDRYFTETEADAKFFHLVEGAITPAGLDADTVDGQHAADLIGSALPLGSIMIWYGTDANVPSGWSICNGGSGTPDLRDKFVVGAGDTYNVGDTGGVASVTPAAGTVAVAGHALTLDEMPAHTHSFNDYAAISTRNDYHNYSPYVALATGMTYDDTFTGYKPESSAAEHDHDGSSSTITSENIDNRPPYHALYYIQKVS